MTQPSSQELFKSAHTITAPLQHLTITLVLHHAGMPIKPPPQWPERDPEGKTQIRGSIKLGGRRGTLLLHVDDLHICRLEDDRLALYVGSITPKDQYSVFSSSNYPKENTRLQIYPTKAGKLNDGATKEVVRFLTGGTLEPGYKYGRDDDASQTQISLLHDLGTTQKHPMGTASSIAAKFLAWDRTAKSLIRPALYPSFRSAGRM